VWIVDGPRLAHDKIEFLDPFSTAHASGISYLVGFGRRTYAEPLLSFKNFTDNVELVNDEWIPSVFTYDAVEGADFYITNGTRISCKTLRPGNVTLFGLASPARVLLLVATMPTRFFHAWEDFIIPAGSLTVQIEVT
jgi:hypothetical protein